VALQVQGSLYSGQFATSRNKGSERQVQEIVCSDDQMVEAIGEKIRTSVASCSTIFSKDLKVPSCLPTHSSENPEYAVTT
jgi:hypothetical protein